MLGDSGNKGVGKQGLATLLFDHGMCCLVGIKGSDFVISSPSQVYEMGFT